MFKRFKKFKKTSSIILSLVLLLSIFIIPSQSFATNAINVTINGTPVSFNDTTGYPFIDSNNRTLVPLRATMEAYGCGITWRQDIQTAYVYKDGYYTVGVNMNSPYISVGGNSIPIDTSAKIVNGRVYLPIRPVLEAFGANVNFNNTTYTIEITKGSGGYVTSANSTTTTTTSSSSSASSIPCYTDHPTVPDFGAITGATVAYKTGTAYCYNLDSFKAESIKNYTEYLPQKGFSYQGTFTNDNGYSIVCYKNESIDTVVAFGVDKLDGTPYYFVMIWD